MEHNVWMLGDPGFLAGDVGFGSKDTDRKTPAAHPPPRYFCITFYSPSHPFYRLYPVESPSYTVVSRCTLPRDATSSVAGLTLRSLSFGGAADIVGKCSCDHS